MSVQRYSHSRFVLHPSLRTDRRIEPAGFEVHEVEDQRFQHPHGNVLYGAVLAGFLVWRSKSQARLNSLTAAFGMGVNWTDLDVLPDQTGLGGIGRLKGWKGGEKVRVCRHGCAFLGCAEADVRGTQKAAVSHPQRGGLQNVRNLGEDRFTRTDPSRLSGGCWGPPSVWRSGLSVSVNPTPINMEPSRRWYD
jgi:hypothetical protein